ncbi:hypothetical protein CLONEX_02099 [[Clostridium] nexile DSM 1787]|jgi:hypothetical protein|nr:hypothetical protein CLONEX_02099 [[Clostridium] nexile DSM 1787]
MTVDYYWIVRRSCGIFAIKSGKKNLNQAFHQEVIHMALIGQLKS